MVKKNIQLDPREQHGAGIPDRPLHFLSQLENFFPMLRLQGLVTKRKYKEAKGEEEGAKRKRTLEENSPSRKKKAKTSAQEEAKTATIPLGLDCFTFHHKLGEGNFGQVILAKDIIRQELVAIKKADKQYFLKWKEDFIEGDILSMSHAFHILIHGLAAFENLNHLYYVMELAGGGDLSDFIIKQFPLNLDIVKFIGAELVYGHGKILDFGLSIRVPSGKSSDICGSPGYTAPEVTNSKSYGPGVDWFSFGIILYIMVTKRLPFPANTESESYPASLGPETIDVIKRLLCKVPGERLEVTGRIQEHALFSNINWKDVEAGRPLR
ncbi:protein kinase C theta type-like [Hyla sarda]|uniref:protein kinase C theta type-like n=1 Tax=Hyla sarda TaxID=327740 RepID=UPI0024C33153|nr:protein kinase C theta type-like [Hyla sarda]